MTNKQRLRQQLRSIRANMSRDLAAQNSAAITEQLSQIIRTSNPDHVGIYVAIGNEVDITALISAHPQVTFFAPICQPDFNLKWGRISHLDALEVNPLGILEPNATNALVEQDLDIMCIPLVGFNDQGLRLGMGGGYYDRALAITGRENCLKIGCAHQLQWCDSIPTDTWDYPMDLIITEKGFTGPKSRQFPQTA